MKLKSFYKNLILLLFLSAGFFFWGETSAAYAWVPGGAHGTVYMRDFDNNMIPLQDVKINREDNWTWSYCQEEKCWGVNDTVETTSQEDGSYDLDNKNNIPQPVEGCATEHGANRCLTGPLGEVSGPDSCPKADDACCHALNWCGFNCGSNPHRWKAYFPTGYILPGSYSATEGHWEAPSEECGASDEPWQTSTAGYKTSSAGGYEVYYQRDFNNYQDIYDCDFVWVPETLAPTQKPLPGCNQECQGNDECQGNLVCHNGLCRNDSCLEQTNCVCPGAPTAPPTGQPTTPPSQPTNTPAPTTPPGEPTYSPAPTVPRTPTVPANATSTPAPQASCDCYDMWVDYPNPRRVSKGDKVQFSTEAYTKTPQTAKVLNMIYSVSINGVEIGKSEAVQAQFVREEVVQGVQSDVYKTSWQYTVPFDTQAGLYKAVAKINCGWKESAGSKRVNQTFAMNRAKKETQSGVSRSESRDFKVSRTTAKVLAANTEKKEFFLLRWLKNLFGKKEEPQVNQVNKESVETSAQKEKDATLKLGTFKPVPTLPPSGCTETYFQVLE